ncbi:YwmB family TATA-box binding protein [Halalkalibacter alkaliphilus]|uniref:YwmB family TATA-box binding protein n=1 Tax=Halalkalibacter alkaliphilus TaxID=2917993 RepID=A0A9X2CX98_9BACI|nr:YwmB family TATA-box binding protein [Halalkalibacter alkaliphilus]MCL7749956.1 YwmB family TATA-box binding protein [Halalkalibacter alkaliphilus]
MIKNIILYSVIISAMFGLYKTQSVSSDTNQVHELKEMIHVATEENMSIRNWTVYSKLEKNIGTDARAFDRFVIDMKDEYRGFKWIEEEVRSGPFRKVVGTKSMAETNTDERVVITSHESTKQQMVSITYQITGEKWDEDMFDVISEKAKGDDTYVTIRATMEREANDELDRLAKNLVELFSGQVKEGLEESNFVSLSAYTEEWDSGIAINESENINLQIGVRDLGNGGSVDITMGTPIITGEY